MTQLSDPESDSAAAHCWPVCASEGILLQLKVWLPN